MGQKSRFPYDLVKTKFGGNWRGLRSIRGHSGPKNTDFLVNCGSHFRILKKFLDQNIGFFESVIFAIGSGRVRPTVHALEIKKSIYQLLTPEWNGQSQNEPNLPVYEGILGPFSVATC